MNSFEKWYLSNDIKPVDLTKDIKGYYKNIDVARMYMAYQSGRDAQRESDAKICANLYCNDAYLDIKNNTGEL